VLTEAALAGHSQPDDRDREPQETLPAELSFGVDRFLDGIETWTATKTHGGG
jgi:hypothetical protein